MRISRSNAVLVMVVVVALVVAAAVVQDDRAGGTNTTTAPAAAGANGRAAAGLTDSSLETSSTGSALSASDPAQQVPDLDQFTSHDPFIQVTAAPITSPTPTPSASSSPSPTPRPTPAALQATVRVEVRLGSRSINETFSDRRRGDSLPPSQPLLSIAAVFGDRVKFDLVGGYVLVGASGDKTFEVWRAKPSSRSIRKGGRTTVCSVSVLRIGDAQTGGSSNAKSPLGPAAGHTIEVLQIGANDGVPSASFEVDGVLYTGEEVGENFTSDWGQIAVLGADDAARTVTIEHGDLEETLRVGQPVSQ
jgi:hypothetical protein